MKRAPPALIVPGVLLAVLAAALGVLRLPSTQRWLILRSVAGHRDVKVTLGGVSAGFFHGELTDLQVEKNGVVVRCAQVQADYSLWPLLFSHHLVAHRLTASGVMVEAQRAVRVPGGLPGTAAAPTAATGVLGRVELPWLLTLDDCAIDGRATIAGAAARAPIAAEFRITGGKFAPDAEGTLLLLATLKDPTAGAPVAALHLQVVLHATETTQRTFRRVALTSVIDADGPELTEQTQLKIAAEMQRSPAGEGYAFNVDTLLHGTPENILAVHATTAAGKKETTGEWTMKVRTAQLAPFALNTPLPEFDAQGAGRFSLNQTAGGAALQGSLEARASRLEEIAPPLRAIGAVQLHGQFDLALEDGVAKFSQLDLQVANEHPVLELQAAHAAEVNFRERKLQVGGSTGGEVLELNLQGLPVTWIRPFLGAGADFSGGVVTGRLTVTGEADRLLLHMSEPLRVTQLDVARGGEKLLAGVDFAADANAVLTKDALQVVLRKASIVTAAGDTANFQATLSVPVGPDPAIATTINYDGVLPSLLKRWWQPGALRTSGNAELAFAGSEVRVQHFDATLADPSGQMLVKAESLRSFTFDSATWQARLSGGAAGSDLVKLSVGRIPLGALAGDEPAVTGSLEPAVLIGTADAGRMVFHALAPVKLSGVALQVDRRTGLTGLQILFHPELTIAGPRDFSLRTGEATVADSAARTLATGQGEGGRAGDGSAHGALAFSLEIPALAAQPAFAGGNNLSGGRATGEVRLALGATQQLEARVTLNGLVAATGGAPMPVANLSFRATVQPDGHLAISAPLLLDRSGQRSDLNFAFDLVPAGREMAIAGKLTGEHVELSDAFAVLGLFSGAGAPAAAPETVTAKDAAATDTAASSPGVDQAAAWSHFHGHLDLDIKSATAGPQWSMTGLTGALTIDPQRLSLEKLAADFGPKSQLAAKAAVTFTGGPTPYATSGEFTLTEFDLGKFFRGLHPDRPPTIEGLFGVTARFSGASGTLHGLSAQTQGTVDLTGRQGVLRLLRRGSGKNLATKAVGIANALDSMFGTDSITKTAEKIAPQSYYVDQLGQNLADINYDQLTVHLSRDQTLNLNLDDVSVVSPDVRLVGKGVVTYQPDLPLLDQPLTLTMAFGARGKIEQILGRLSLLDGTRDDLGYSQTKIPLGVAGTLARPDPKEYYTRVIAGKILDAVAPAN